ncbi:MAG: hypothetical protein ACXV7D_02220 [Thermoanaerobaculia bacterium]
MAEDGIDRPHEGQTLSPRLALACAIAQSLQSAVPLTSKLHKVQRGAPHDWHAATAVFCAWFRHAEAVASDVMLAPSDLPLLETRAVSMTGGLAGSA